ncbi:hypothetical protein COX69_00195 [Candidatus Falkowbacteria bacterium CG_4_10_14_0_2_um_filter_48_10]|uniref:Uncharacterized protein n=1 Tax=Candidatus Falkowbacteria bacterium CG23_combo_of_CG06-09_8_20_14_all_49_15 TaxID=1974572 RepID=A0A2G9ZLI9_9BACT|nr:MAG: hypothetical protein COX22_01265 [Candidatus Falkowbacteria bacterium CG23_combo_of_CG06-09_8_20_14_all_49_15]PJA09344.1 MAG: hypothetical protein COX69_00195 [Candidatus Falkowbacteria bacterium CG_4_10_14_0_2_um_filter_48_10]
MRGQPATKRFVISPYKGREVKLDKVDEDFVEKFLVDNYDFLAQIENYLGGWRNIGINSRASFWKSGYLFLDKKFSV